MADISAWMGAHTGGLVATPLNLPSMNFEAIYLRKATKN